MTLKWPWMLKGWMYSICVTSILEFKFHSVSLYDQPFSRYTPFWDKCTELLRKWPWILQSRMCPIYVFVVSTSSKFHSVSLYDQPLWSYRCTEWPQNDLEPYYKVKCTPYICYYPRVPNFSPFHSDQPSSRYRPFWDKCTEWPKMTLNPKRSNIPIYIQVLPIESQISLFHSTTIHFRNTSHFETKYTEWPQNDIEHYKDKGTPYTGMCCWYPRVPNFSPFCSTIIPHIIPHWLPC